MKILRIVPNVSSDLFEASRDFYVELFDLVVSVELADWYLQLMAADEQSLNIGFLRPAHELFADRASPPGSYSIVLTIQVDDVDEAYTRARRLGAEIPLACATKTTDNVTSWWSTPTVSYSTS
jgi:hypothetical protein